MSECPRKSRRHFLGLSVASLGAAALAPPATLSGILQPLARTRSTAAGPPTATRSAVAAAPAGAGDPAVVAAAKAALGQHGARIGRRDLVGVADFGRPSSQPRLHLVDLASGRTDTLLVAHGRGSDPDHTGWLSRFSNAPGSDATCAGAFLTGDCYSGDHGPSMRLVGLDSSNSKAEARGIVVHSAWYVGPGVVQAHGMLGRSEGCFAVSQADLPQVLRRLGPGRLLVSTRI